MRHSPLRLLVSGYGLAAVVAVLAAYSGVGFGASLLLFWLGGAAAVFALALMPGVRALFTRPVPEWPSPAGHAQDRAFQDAGATADSGRGALPLPMVETV